MIHERIKQLENELKETSFNPSDDGSSQNPGYTELVPFIMMFIFLNFEVKSNAAETNVFDQARKETHVRKSILKKANACVRKFENSIPKILENFNKSDKKAC